jgi:hypothetical protein
LGVGLPNTQSQLPRAFFTSCWLSKTTLSDTLPVKRSMLDSTICSPQSQAQNRSQKGGVLHLIPHQAHAPRARRQCHLSGSVGSRPMTFYPRLVCALWRSPAARKPCGLPFRVAPAPKKRRHPAEAAGCRVCALPDRLSAIAHKTTTSASEASPARPHPPATP